MDEERNETEEKEEEGKWRKRKEENKEARITRGSGKATNIRLMLNMVSVTSWLMQPAGIGRVTQPYIR